MIIRPRIYSASKIWFAPEWNRLRDKCGYNIVSRWHDIPCGTKERPEGAKKLAPSEKTDLWIMCLQDVSRAEMLIVYGEPTDEQRGALVEIGMAFGQNKPVFAIGECKSFTPCEHSDVAFTHHPLWHWINAKTIDDGYAEAIAAYHRWTERRFFRKAA